MNQPSIERQGFRIGVKFTLIAHLTTVISLFTALSVAARYLSKGEFGSYVLFTVAVQFLIILVDFGQTNAIIKFLSSDSFEPKDLISTALCSSILIAVSISGILFLIGYKLLYVFEFPNIKYVNTTLALLFFSQYMLTRFYSFMQGLHLYKEFAYIRILEALLKLIGIVIFVTILEMQIYGILYAIILSAIISAILAYFLIPWFIIPKIKARLLKEMFFFGFPLQVNDFLGWLFERTDTIMIGKMISLASVGIYEIGYKIPNQLRALFVAYRSVLFPHLSKLYSDNDKIEADYLLKETLRIVSFIMAIATLLAVLYGKVVLLLLFTQKYAYSGVVLPILMIGISIGLCNFIISTALIASSRQKCILLASIPEAILNIGLNFLLIPQLDIIGAALASALSRAIVNPIFIILLNAKLFFDYFFSYFGSFISLAISCILFWNLQHRSYYSDATIFLVFFVSAIFYEIISGFLFSQNDESVYSEENIGYKVKKFFNNCWFYANINIDTTLSSFS